jgi:hypothetical protein
LSSFKNAEPLRARTNASKDFFMQGNKLIEQLESDINEWRNKIGSKAEVTHIATSATEHKDNVESWQTRFAVTIWYEL